MSFKQFLTELTHHENGQAIVSLDPVEMNTPQQIDPMIMEKINDCLTDEMDMALLTPDDGIQKARQILYRYGLDMPPIYVTDSSGDELVLGLVRQAEPEVPVDAYLYFIYVLEDSGNYLFHAEIVSGEDLDEILSEDDEEDEND